jgi:hypothetical protein
MLITMEEIAPFATKKFGSMVEHLIEKIGKSPTVDLSFNHARGSLNKNKQKKLKTLLNDSQLMWIRPNNCSQGGCYCCYDFLCFCFFFCFGVIARSLILLVLICIQTKYF